MEPSIHLREAMYGQLTSHLLAQDHDLEEAAFLLARVEVTASSVSFHGEEAICVPPDGFAFRSEYYLELDDTFRAEIMRRAWQSNRALVELHSHPRQRTPARFSPSDIAGLREFVPHTWWRLDRRPYAAVVMALGSFDALAWCSSPAAAETPRGLVVGDRVLRPTGLSLAEWEERRA